MPNSFSLSDIMRISLFYPCSVLGRIQCLKKVNNTTQTKEANQQNITANK